MPSLALMPRISSARLSLAVALAALACHDGTSPNRGVDVTIVATVASPSFGADTAGRPTITCRITFDATAEGEGTATWLDAMYRFYYGTNRTVPVDSFPIPASEVTTAFETETIAPGQTETSGLTATAGIPFSGEVEFHYRSSSGAAKSTKADFTCGPAVPADATPPVVTSLTVTPSTGKLDPGAALTVSYGASAQAGLWQTLLTIGGPCTVTTRFAEQLKASTTHQLSVPLPRSCKLGLPIAVEVDATDGAAETTRRQLVTPLVIADTQPPTVASLNSMAGDYFAGDTLTIWPNAADNHALASVDWKVLPYGATDSVLTPDGSPPGAIHVPLATSWSGPIQVEVWARDAAGLTSDTAVSPPDSVRVHPTIAHPARTVTVDGLVDDMVFDARRGVVYLRESFESRILVLSTSTMQVSSQIDAHNISDFDLTAGGDSLLVVAGGRGALGVVDLRQSVPAVAWIPLAGVDSFIDVPFGVRVGANGKAYLSFGGSAETHEKLLEVDLATGAQRVRTDAGSGGDIGEGVLERSLDHGTIAINSGTGCLQRLDLGTDAVGGCVNPGNDWPPTLDGDGARMAVGVDIYDLTTLRARVPASLDPAAFTEALSPDGAVLFVLGGGGAIVRVDAGTGQILDRMLTPFTSSRLRISPDGTTLVGFRDTAAQTSEVVLVDLTH